MYRSDKAKAPIIMLDNMDSFTYNLVDQFQRLGHAVQIFRNNLSSETIIKQLSQHKDPILVLSPGPGHPGDAGCLLELIQRCRGKLPILGVCLGHQALVESYGGSVEKATQVYHGKASRLKIITPHAIFNDLNDGLLIARYHSLVAKNLPESLQLIATSEGEVMIITHESDKACGFQFHPESILTAQGEILLQNTLAWLQS